MINDASIFISPSSIPRSLKNSNFPYHGEKPFSCSCESRGRLALLVVQNALLLVLWYYLLIPTGFPWSIDSRVTLPPELMISCQCGPQCNCPCVNTPTPQESSPSNIQSPSDFSSSKGPSTDQKCTTKSLDWIVSLLEHIFTAYWKISIKASNVREPIMRPRFIYLIYLLCLHYVRLGLSNARWW